MSGGQEWFNGKYSDKENIDISEKKKLKLKGSLQIKDFTKLRSVSLKKFELTNLHISGCSQLTKVDLDLPILESLSITVCPKLTTLNCSSTGLTSLEVNNCSQLEKFDLSQLPKLTSLSVTECSNLTKLDCSTTGLTSLEIFNCPRLNNITDSKFTKSKSLHVRGYQNLITLSETGFTSLKISGCSQLYEVDLSKFPKITSLFVIDCSKLTKFDCSSTGLTNLKISACYNLKEIDLSKLLNLTSLSVTDCLSLDKLDCSNHDKLNDLEVSDLTELYCSNTLIEELSLNLCPYITKLDCSKNDKLINLDVSNCSKLRSISCSQSKLTNLDLRYCPDAVVDDRSDLKIERGKKNLKNILIVGRTGGGKSTLANVLTNSDDFKESAYAVSETKLFRKKEFKGNISHFRVVDTIGAGDTRLSLKDVLYKIADGVYAMPEGISQILYVVDGRFTKEEINTFNMIKNHILEINIISYVTLVRTKFDNFRNKEECGIDIRKMRDESKTIAEIVDSCNEVIHVDNPPVNIEANDDGDDDHNAQINVNKIVRKKSRKILLDYLEDVDPVKGDEPFKLKTWDNLHESIHKYVKTEEDARKRLENDPELEAIYKTAELCLIL